MKQIILGLTIFVSIITICYSQANQKLSNLISPTAVNVNLLADSNNKRNLGSSSASWKNLYLRGDIYLDGARFITNPGTGNTAIGAGVLNSITTGSYNTGVGLNALKSNVDGTNNTAFGVNALIANTTGNNNAASGVNTLNANTTGYSNTASGAYALYFNTTGVNNTACGNNALYSNTIGNDNTAAGVNAMRSNTTGDNNTAYGVNALYMNYTGANNTAFGMNALYRSIEGGGNSAFGVDALYSNRSIRNTASGYQALYTNYDGYENTANGVEALYYNTSGIANTAAGGQALRGNTTGNGNTAIGWRSLYANTTGSDNVAVGYSSLSHNAGHENTAVGTGTLCFNTYGVRNTALGLFALNSNTTGSYNTAIGYFAGINDSNYNNSSSFGSYAANTASNQVRIGNNQITSIGGYANWSNISDGRVKKNIKSDVPGLTFINKLKPVTYNLNLNAADNIIQRPAIKTPDGKTVQPSQEEITARKRKEEIIYTGFIAQDVEKAAKELNYNFSGVDAAKNDKDLYGLRYAEFVVPLVKAVQELSAENDELKARLNKIEQMLASNEPLNTGRVSSTVTLSSARLEQNIPNPFNENTLINYYVPENAGTAIIKVSGMKGDIVKTISITSKGNGQLTLQTTQMTAGTYTYTLIVDNKIIDTKKMIVSK